MYLDVTAPDITCPFVKRQYADLFKNSTSVYWDAPTYFDTSGEALILQQFDGNQPNGSTFEIGRHELGYMVSDGNNNTAKCSFQINIGG